MIPFVGRGDDPRKGLDVLLRAIAEMMAAIKPLLAAVGNGNPKEAIRIAKDLGVSDCIKILGFVDSAFLRHCYRVSDVHVSSSGLEGFGQSVAEAMLMGKNVVATRVGEVPDIVNDGENGILVSNESHREIGNAAARIPADEAEGEILEKQCAEDSGFLQVVQGYTAN